MTEDEALALYGAIKKLAGSMAAREAALASKMAALETAIEELRQLPAMLGEQTGQSIAAGVRQSIQDDFRLPIEAAVHKPLRELNQATDQARHVMAEVGRESRFQTWTWLGILLLLGVFLGAFGCYYFVQSDIAQINQRLDIIQQQISARPAIGKEEYRHHRR